jgi:hypothetical protein
VYRTQVDCVCTRLRLTSKLLTRNKGRYILYIIYHNRYILYIEQWRFHRVRLYIIYAHLCNHILLQSGWWDLGHNSVHCQRCGSGPPSDVTPGVQTTLYAEDRGFQFPMVLKYGPVTSSDKAAPGPDPRIRHRIQIGTIRPIRVDHTNCLQLAIKNHSFMRLQYTKS